MPIFNQARMTTKQRKKFDKAKKNIDKSYQYFKQNYDRFNRFVHMTFVSTLSPNEKMFLLSKNRPLMEFNILEPYISRLRGEFINSQIDIKVGRKSEAGMDDSLPPEVRMQKEKEQIAQLKFVEGHLRHIFHEMKVNGVEYDLLTKTLTGGYAAAKVYADYKDDKSFDQQIFVRPVFDPTLIGFDMLATKHDKSDAEYFWEAYPMNKERFEKEYSDIDLEGLGNTNSYEGIKWSYRSEQEDIVLLVDYYFKKRSKKRLVKLSDGSTMLMDEYKKFAEWWDEMLFIPQMPQIVEERMTTVETIWRYKMIGNHLLEEEETDLPFFPYIYIDGNSELIKNQDNSNVQFMTRPYIYNAISSQKLKNYSGQSLAYGMMKMIQSPFMASTDSLRGQDAEPWRNPQDANVLTFNAFKDDDPNVPLQPPIQLAPTPLPPEIMGTFEMADSVAMNTLGNFDPQVNAQASNPMSGKAYQQVQIMSTAAAKPYIVSMIRGMQSIAESIVTLIPMIHTDKATLPVRDSRGLKSYVKINQDGGVSMKFRPDDLDVSLEAGPSFQVQQAQSQAALDETAKAFPGFAALVEAKALPILVDNLRDIRGGDELKLMANEFMQEMAEMKERAKGQPNPEMMMVQVAQQQVSSEAQTAMARVDAENRKTQVKAMVDMANVEIAREKNQIELAKAIASISSTNEKTSMEKGKIEYDKILAALEASNNIIQMDLDEADRRFNRDMAKRERQIAND